MSIATTASPLFTAFACALAVAAIDDDLISRLDEPMVETLTEFADDPLRSQITVRNLLNLSAGIQSSRDLQPTPRIRTIDIYALSLYVPASFPPGEPSSTTPSMLC